MFRGSQELAAVLAAVAEGTGPEASGTCSRLVSVRSSAEGVIAISGSSKGAGSKGVVSTGSIWAGGEIGTSDSTSGSSTGASGLAGSAGLEKVSVDTYVKNAMQQTSQRLAPVPSLEREGVLQTCLPSSS